MLTIILTSIFLYGCGNSAPTSQPNANQPAVENAQPTTPSALPEAQNPPTAPNYPTPHIPPSSPMPPVAPTAANSAESAKQIISIKDFAFNPSDLTVSVGTTVLWKNEDSAPHRIKSVGFASDILSEGQSFEYKFETAGTYDYFCVLHRSMRGQIIVK